MAVTLTSRCDVRSTVRSLTSFEMTPGSDMLLVCPNRVFNCLGNSIGLAIDFLPLTTFNQQPNLWLGSGITQQDASFARKFLLRFANKLHHVRKLIERRFTSHPQIPLRLWVFL